MDSPGVWLSLASSGAASRYFLASPGTCDNLDVSAHCVSSGLVDATVRSLADLYNGAQIRHVAAQLRNRALSRESALQPS